MADRSDRPDPSVTVREALRDTGLDLVASASADTYDAVAPDAFQSARWLPGARGVVVAGSSGPLLWRRFRATLGAPVDGSSGLEVGALRAANAFDGFVRGLLDRADRALAQAEVRFLRFEAAFAAAPRVDFRALGRLVGLGAPGPFGMLIHPVHGPWWALRGAWLVDHDVRAADDLPSPCAGCPAPCIGGWAMARPPDVVLATPEVRARCVIGQRSRYDADQIAYHHPSS